MNYEENNDDEQNLFNQRSFLRMPSPLASKVCACGCGNKFTPRRKDQRFLNSKHYDYFYNHNTRKRKNRNKTKAIKVLSKNNRLLKEYYDLYAKNGVAQCSISTIVKRGFDLSFFTGIEKNEKDGLEYLYVFDFSFSINGNIINIIKI